jgi:hypothetical protein
LVGSQTTEGTGAGVYRWDSKEGLASVLDTTVFQAKKYAVQACIRRIWKNAIKTGTSTFSQINKQPLWHSIIYKLQISLGLSSVPGGTGRT